LRLEICVSWPATRSRRVLKRCNLVCFKSEKQGELEQCHEELKGLQQVGAEKAGVLPQVSEAIVADESGEKTPASAQTEQPGFWNEGNVRSATVAIMHPAAE